MSGRKKRRRWKPEEKLRIVLAGLEGAIEISGLCRREGTSLTQYYGWKKQLMNSAGQVFSCSRVLGRPVSAGPAAGRLPHAVREFHSVSCDQTHPSPRQRPQFHLAPTRALQLPPNDDARVHRDPPRGARISTEAIPRRLYPACPAYRGFCRSTSTPLPVGYRLTGA